MAQPLTYDIALGVDGDLPVRIRHIAGFDLIVQRVARRLRTFLGEWRPDHRVGLPFFAWAAQRPPDVAGIGAVIRREIESVPGVSRVDDFAGTFDRDTRELSYTGTIRTADGDAELVVIPFGEAGNRHAAVRLLVQHRGVAP